MNSRFQLNLNPVALIFHKILYLLFRTVTLPMLPADHIDCKHEGATINYVPDRDYSRNIMPLSIIKEVGVI